MSEKLKSCPFCGSSDLRQESSTFRMNHLVDNQLFWVQCCHCGSRGGFELTKEESEKRWNQRYRPNHVVLFPPGADGKPLLLGETVYRKEDGHKVTVAQYVPPVSGEAGVIVDTSDVTSYWIRADRLTHEKPDDSWEEIAEDIALLSGAYCEKWGIPLGDHPRDTQAFDIVARAKKLASQ